MGLPPNVDESLLKLLKSCFSVIYDQGLKSSKAVQNQKKEWGQSEVIGRLKYNQQLLKQTLAEVEEVKLMLRTIFAGLKDSFNFEKPLIERIVCVDEIDKDVLQLLFEAGSSIVA